MHIQYTIPCGKCTFRGPHLAVDVDKGNKKYLSLGTCSLTILHLINHVTKYFESLKVKFSALRSAHSRPMPSNQVATTDTLLEKKY